MCSALVVGDGVDFVDDDGADVTKVLAGFACGEQDVEGLGRGDEDVGRVAEHGGTVFGESVAGADSSADFMREIAALEGKLLNLAKGLIEILLDVVGEGFERGDVEDLRGGGEGSGDGLAEELVDADEEGGQGFAGAGGGGDEGGLAGEDGGPAVLLGFCGGTEFAEEPLGGDGVSPGERGWYFYRGWWCGRLGRHGCIVARNFALCSPAGMAL